MDWFFRQPIPLLFVEIVGAFVGVTLGGMLVFTPVRRRLQARFSRSSEQAAYFGTQIWLAYTLILSDVYRWLMNRTDLWGTAREMIPASASSRTTAGLSSKEQGAGSEKRKERGPRSGPLERCHGGASVPQWHTRAGVAPPGSKK